ncbi:hypothetical protein [Rhizohabitans arisaemae]|uniref:hypothetical protein n=1 Tax=Rhizohabitans arisaemae TaxID=2720610 RepID=UPI0024B0937C|nr:hypothetical protein [Rhizohabitans arisaemae]
MHVTITATGETPRLEVEDADDCSRLHIHADGLDDETVGEALRTDGMGRPAGAGRMWLDVRALRERARTGARSDDWDERFDAMLGYARRKGWLSDDGTCVAAHLKRSES